MPSLWESLGKFGKVGEFRVAKSLNMNPTIKMTEFHKKIFGKGTQYGAQLKL